MDKYAKVLEKLANEPENKTCFDCGVTSPKWASVNNAVFVCLTCAGKHRGLGVHISFIRSVTMDHWDIKQIKVISQGGNRRLRLLLEEYGIGNEGTMDIAVKYSMKVMEYYRKLLRAEAFGEEMPMKPDYTSGIEEIESSIVNTVIDNQRFISSQQCCSSSEDYPGNNNRSNDNNILNSVGSFFGNTINDIQSGISNMHIKEKANDFGKKTVNYFGEKTHDVMQSSFVQSIFQKSKNLLGMKGKDSEESQAQREFYRKEQEWYDNNTTSDNNKKKRTKKQAKNDDDEGNTKIDDIGKEKEGEGEMKKEDDQDIYNFFSPPTKELESTQIPPQQKDNVFDTIFDNNNNTNNNNDNFEDIFRAPKEEQPSHKTTSGIEDLTEDIFKH